MIRALHDGMVARVIHQNDLNDLSEEFRITCGLKQRCVFVPILFSLYLAAMLYEIPQNNPGVNIKYRLTGGLFNLSRLRSKNLTYPTTVTELQYADDNAALAHTTNHFQQSVNNFHAAYSRFGLTIDSAKTKILAQPPSQSALPDFLITIAGKDIERVEHFPYLGSFLSVQCTSAKDVENRLRAAHAAFGRLTSCVFLNKDLNYTTKLTDGLPCSCCLDPSLWL